MSEDEREAARVETYWEIVEANQGGTGGETLLGIARQTINYEDRLIDVIKRALDAGETIDDAIARIHRGEHQRGEEPEPEERRGRVVIPFPRMGA